MGEVEVEDESRRVGLGKTRAIINLIGKIGACYC